MAINYFIACFVWNLKRNTMAITKQYLKSKPVCKVTFTVPAEEAAKVFVVGDFNDWNPKKGTLRKLKNGINIKAETFFFRLFCF